MIKGPFQWRREPDLSYRIIDAAGTYVAQIDAGLSAVCQEASARAITNALNAQHSPAPKRRMKTRDGSEHDECPDCRGACCEPVEEAAQPAVSK